jgi:hypothetical protein
MRVRLLVWAIGLGSIVLALALGDGTGWPGI